MRFLSQIWLFLFLFPTFLIAEQINFPKIETPKEAIEYLLRLQERVPNLLDERDNSGTNPITKSIAASQYARILETEEDYLSLLKSRKKEIDLFIENDRGEIQIDPIAFKSFLDFLRESSPPSKNPLPKGTAQGFLSGLASILPRDKRNSLFSQSADLQLQSLQRELPADLIKAGFRSENFGITQETLSPEDALKILAERKQFETGMVRELLKKVLPPAPLTPEKLAKTLSSEGWKKSREKLAKTGKALGLQDTVIEDAAKLWRSSQTKKAAEEKPFQEIHLQEAAPWEALFRGCAGGDCSTSISYHYTFGPLERFFYVRDSEGALKGYVQGITVTVEGKSAFYVHTISGPRISPDDVAIIFDGLYNARAKLGVKEIALPSNTKERLNYQEIADAFQEISQGNERFSVILRDEKVREQMDYTSRTSHDSVESHDKAVFFSPSSEKVALKTRVKKRDVTYPVDSIINHTDILFLARAPQARSIPKLNETLSEMGIHETTHAAFNQILDNKEEKKASIYLADVKKLFSDMGIADSDAYLKKYETEILFGLMKSPDVLKSSHSEALLRKTLRVLKYSEKIDRKTSAFLAKNSEKLWKRQDYRDAVIKFLRRSNDFTYSFVDIFGADPDSTFQKALAYIAMNEPALRDAAIETAPVSDGKPTSPFNVFFKELRAQIQEKNMSDREIMMLRYALGYYFNEELVTKKLVGPECSEPLLNRLGQGS
jgi:hypothetical protein